jgi:Cdc6-like AAA superfamily ATPase
MEELTQNIINARSASIYGPIGSGKTLLVKIIMRNLKESKIIPIYIDCTKILQEFFLITQIRMQFNLPTLLGKSMREYLSEAMNYAQKSNLKPWIILDEFQFFVRVSGDEIIRTLLDYGAIFTLISTRLDVHTMLSQSILNKLDTKIILPSYTKEQLFTILKQRVEEGNGRVADEALMRIAEHASITGDARLAIFILKNAVMKAKEENAERVEIRHVEGILENADYMMMRDIVSKLSPHEQVYLKAIIELYNTIKDKITFERAYEAYTSYAKSMQLQPLSMQMVNKIIIPRLTSLNIIMVGRVGKDRKNILTPNSLLLEQHSERIKPSHPLPR